MGDPRGRWRRPRLPSRRRIVSSLIPGLLRVTPTRPQVTVYGWPDHEGNGVALVRFLAEHSGERRVVWLTNARGVPSAAGRWVDGARVLPKRSIRGFWAYLRSDVVCFTHGLYGSPDPRRGRVFINLWHGDGPKRTENPRFAARPGATAIVAQTRLWGEKKAVELGMPASSVLLVGNPRIDDFAEPMTAEQRRGLAELLGPRFILWMPTYRDSNGGGGSRHWSDGRRLSDTGHMAALAEQARAAGAVHGITLAVKPHPMDRDVYAGVPGLLSIDDEALHRLGVSLYQVLGASEALITDYSSVWTDYLVVDRPVLLLCPDYDEYAANRGFNVPDLRAVAPGPLVQDAAALEAFIADVAAGRDPFRARRLELIEEIGAVHEPGASARLWEEVARLRAGGRPSARVEERAG